MANKKKPGKRLKRATDSANATEASQDDILSPDRVSWSYRLYSRSGLLLLLGLTLGVIAMIAWWITRSPPPIAPGVAGR